MTRNFKQSRRDDEQPNSRRYSGRYEGEQSPRPARPRLNRASVDRAWESGAPQRHHDYRTRDTNNTRGAQPRQQGQPYRANRGQYSPNDSPSAPNGRNYRKPSFQRQENRQYDDRQPRRYGDSRPYDSGQRSYDERPYGARPRFSPDREQGERRPSYREQERNPPGRPYPQRRNDERDQAPRDYNRPNRYERSSGPNRQYRQGGRRTDTGNARNPRFEGEPRTDSRYARNPRAESRPERFSRSLYRPADNTGEELFEGDYERFNADENTAHGDERHVTRLPDGRVLKGSRKEQREAAAFWTGVDQETQELIPHVEPEQLPENGKEDVPAKRSVTRKKAEGRTARSQAPKAPKTPKAPKATGTTARRVSATAGESRAKKSTAKHKSAKTTASGTQPSKRGYKWPKPE